VTVVGGQHNTLKLHQKPETKGGVELRIVPNDEQPLNAVAGYLNIPIIRMLKREMRRFVFHGRVLKLVGCVELSSDRFYIQALLEKPASLQIIRQSLPPHHYASLRDVELLDSEGALSRNGMANFLFVHRGENPFVRVITRYRQGEDHWWRHTEWGSWEWSGELYPGHHILYPCQMSA
jgi:hypothetical protein